MKTKQQRREEKKLFRKYVNDYDRIDYKIIFTTFVLCGFGLLMIYSASSFQCSIDSKFKNDGLYFIKRQFVFDIIGILAFLGILKFMNYKWLIKFSKLIYIIGILCVFLLFTPLAYSAYNATRWIQIGPFTIQVAEIVKIAVIIYLAGIAYKRYAYRGEFKTVAMMWGVGLLGAGLIFVISNDLSSAIIIAGITFCITYIVTTYKKTHIAVVLFGFTAVLSYVSYLANHLPSPEELADRSFRVGRLAAWISPETYTSGFGYQTIQSLYAISLGGLWGKGFGNGVQKLNSIPEAQNDMIFAIVCEELGLVGGMLLIAVFIYLIFLLVKVSANCDDVYGATLVAGIALHIALQTVINIGVVVGLIPNTGVSLPFISYGGSAAVITLAEIGLAISVYRVSIREKIVEREAKEQSYGAPVKW